MWRSRVPLLIAVIIENWHRRLRAYRTFLNTCDDEQGAFVVRMRARILTFLLTRYDGLEPKDAQALAKPLNAGLFAWRFDVRPPVEASEDFPPRGVEELREGLRGIQGAVETGRSRNKGRWKGRERARSRVG